MVTGLTPKKLGFATFMVKDGYKFRPYFFFVKNKKLHPGDNLEYYIDLCKLKDKSASVTLWLQDGVIVHLPPLENSNIPVACHETWMSLPLPVNLDEGTYKLVQSLDYKVNPVTTINYTVETEEFTVVHNEPTY